MGSEVNVGQDRQSDGAAASRGLLAALVFLGTLCVYLVTAVREQMHIDAHAAAVAAWRLATAGTPWLEAVSPDVLAGNKFIYEADNGHLVAGRTPGPVLLTLPSYAVARLWPGAAEFSFAPAGAAAAVATALTVLLMFLALSRISPALAVGASLVFAWATPTWTISAAQPWTHSVTQLGIAGAAYACTRDRMFVAGLFMAVAMLGRPHMALVAALLGVGLTLSRRRLEPALKIGVPALASLLLVIGWNRWMFGAWTIGGSYRDRAGAALTGFQGNAEWSGEHAQFVNVLGFFVAPDRGFLVWSPLVLLLLPALLRSWRSQPAWSKLLFVGGLLYTVAQLRLNYFPGGDNFWGYRHGLELLTTALPALTLAVPYAGRLARRAIPVLVAAQFAAFSLGATVSGYNVHIDDVWTDNSLWLLARQEPVVVALWFALCIGTAVLAAARFRLTSRWPQPNRAVPSA